MCLLLLLQKIWDLTPFYKKIENKHKLQTEEQIPGTFSSHRPSQNSLYLHLIETLSLSYVEFFLRVFFCHRILYDSSESRSEEAASHPLALTLVTADAFEADAAVAGSRHIVTGGVVHALAQLLAAVAKRPCRTLCTQE